MNRLHGKVVVIVGGTTGLGLSAARACLAEGARVVAVGRSKDSAHAAERELGGDLRTVVGDAIDPHTADLAVATALSAFSACDALYHVAGGSGRKFGDGPLHEITDDGWTRTLDLNLRSLFNSNRAAVRHFLSPAHGGRGGSVLNMGSVLGSFPSKDYFATHAYAAAKSAALGFTKACAAHYAPNRIRFNVLAPALVETPMAQRAAKDSTILKFISTKQPLDGGRIGRPEDLDDAVVFFLSDASSFCTGQVLYIDGGWQVSEGQLGGAGAGGLDE